ncbi:hypothetical protein Dimus_038317 [Dionaea muscipula]
MVILNLLVNQGKPKSSSKVENSLSTKNASMSTDILMVIRDPSLTPSYHRAISSLTTIYDSIVVRRSSISNPTVTSRTSTRKNLKQLILQKSITKNPNYIKENI